MPENHGATVGMNDKVKGFEVAEEEERRAER
jgi:hypothetical protein